VNTYDPSDDIVYVHMARDVDPYSVSVERHRTCSRLPLGYANGSPRTRLHPRRRGSAAPLGDGRSAAEVLARIPG